MFGFVVVVLLEELDEDVLLCELLLRWLLRARVVPVLPVLALLWSPDVVFVVLVLLVVFLWWRVR